MVQFYSHTLLPPKKKQKQKQKQKNPQKNKQTNKQQQQTGMSTFATGCGGNSDTCHQDYVVTWQHGLQLLSIQVLICF